MSATTRAWIALAFAVFVATVWLNQGISVRAWEEQRDAPKTFFEAARAPFVFLYRRALDEEMYFGTASAVLGRPYDEQVFALRGDTSLPPVHTPADHCFHAPYSEVPFEYPPPNLPFIVLPRFVADFFLPYARLLGAMMGALLVLAAALGARAAATERDRAARFVGFALLLLAHGALAIQRLDAVVALLLVATVLAARRGKDVELGFWSGLVFATKVLPVLACAAAAVAAGAAHDKKRAARVVLGGAAGVAVGLGPMLLFSPSSLVQLFRYHAGRGLHIESSLGVAYGALRAVVFGAEPGVLDYGSFNFHGGFASALASASTLLVVVLTGVVALVAARSPAEPLTDRIAVAALGGVVAVWLGGKVFSPQYLTWALPLVLLLPAREWRRFALVLGGVLLLSQLYYRGYYDHVYNQRPLGVATMVVRLGLIVALFSMLLERLRRGATA